MFYRGDGAHTATSTSARLTPSRTTHATSALRWSSFPKTPDNNLETQPQRAFIRAPRRRGGKVAHAFGLRWKSPTNCTPSRRSMDSAAFNGDPSWTLTFPGRYVCARDHRIRRRLEAARRPVRSDLGRRPPRRAPSLRFSRERVRTWSSGHARNLRVRCVPHAPVGAFERPVAKPRDLDEGVQRRRVAAPLHNQQPHLPRNRVAFERNGL